MSPVRFFRKYLPALFIASQSQLLYAADLAIEPVMVDIPAGQLTIHPTPPKNDKLTSGASSSQAGTPRNVKIKPFRMGKYEVTTKEFGQFIAATNYPAATTCRQMNSKEWFSDYPGGWKGNKHSSSEFEPVTCIGWDAMQAYIDWLNKETGKHYRLPSEIEWEYAARAGTTTNYYWGDEPAQACTYANVADQAAEAAIKRDYDGLESKDHVGVVPCDDKTGYASVVGIYQPNAFGLHDMIGNINEFTGDCFNEDYPGNATDGSLRLSGDCSKRIIRGGSWHWAPFPTINRGGWKTDFVGALEGFRIAQDIQTTDTRIKPTSKTRKQHARNKQFKKELAKAQKVAL
ncbi:MAG TPA: formylglycine-generating enzyme family protein [Cellvibrio sp.]